MKTYQLTDGDTLVFSADEHTWQRIIFEAKDFQDIQAATAQELVQVLNRSNELATSVDEGENLVMATKSKGGHASLAIDVAQSTAAAGLGLSTQTTQAYGHGLQPARLIGTATAPFALPAGAQIGLVVDGRRRKIIFDKGVTADKATADEVVRVINARQPEVASTSRDERVILTSPSIGITSQIIVEAARLDQNKIDAAAILGFSDANASSQPYEVRPAQLVCRGRSGWPELGIANLTASPIELHLSTRTVVLPGRGTMALLPGEAAQDQLFRLIQRGVLRLLSLTNS